jgi:hypothetical protein
VGINFVTAVCTSFSPHRIIRLQFDVFKKKINYPSIKSRLKLGNACYYSVKNLLSSRILSKHLKINIYRGIVLSVVLYGCENWSLTLREERRLRVFEKKLLMRLFGPKRDDVTGEWRKLHN